MKTFASTLLLCLLCAIGYTIEVEDVSCGNNKVLICHIPPGNPANAELICVSPNALPAHLAHGDCLGPCVNTNNAKTGNTEEEGKENRMIEPFTELFEAHPNPFRETTTITFALSETGHVRLEVYNYIGQSVAVLYDDIVNGRQHYLVEFDTKILPKGVYFSVLSINSERKVLKLVELK